MHAATALQLLCDNKLGKTRLKDTIYVCNRLTIVSDEGRCSNDTSPLRAVATEFLRGCGCGLVNNCDGYLLLDYKISVQETKT
jgi:hypothetical protein